MVNVFAYITFSFYAFYGVTSVQVSTDHSPYCGSLARITDLCNEVFIHIMCPRTCQVEDRIKKVCGLRKFGDAGFGANRRKRNDEEEEIEDLHHRVRRVVGGQASVKGAWPWHVALYYKGEQHCAGAILTPEWVVTAAHCFDKDKTSFNEADWLVVVGEHSLHTNEKTEVLRSIKKIIIHERNYKYWKLGYKNVPDDYDVALLRLSKPLLFNNYISPVCLPGMNENFQSTDQCKIMGWGATKDKGSRQDVLREATVKLIPRDICNLPVSYNGSVHQRAICAGYKSGKADACEYDSGGSMSCKKGNHWFAVGLVSWGYQCGRPNFYGVYTNMPLMKSWIIETLLSYDDETNSIISIFKRIAALNPVAVKVSMTKLTQAKLSYKKREHE